ncbi:hypothetical protein [Alloalcanivorax gelatiniphagus]|uniref:Uncharacterized protein n=1 Tax=Alloalcanivorax gelatiniphagus TaxID=1194167 RepID=A0ABY2XMJ6_9GAMM|nr:hypothetical protein [Alloalcanivorax gelatiniphagus]TMW13608.1 hypothetical protein FGS76_05610 [Alloalcanivorax gelatiniphagus]
MEEDDPDVIVSFIDEEFIESGFANNPKIFKRNETALQVDFGGTVVAWDNIGAKPLNVFVVAREPNYRTMIGYLKKLISMEYPSRIEWFEQILHELILIPTVYFLPGLAPIHAACVGTRGGCVLLTGTGGVGKSSALLSFVDNEEVAFISDDIAVLDADGVVYGNMAWPKIYGYNCVGNGLEKRILAGRNFLNRLHFHIKNKRNPSRVRRKMRPNQLFESCIADGCQLKEVCFLIKNDVETMSLQNLSREASVDLAFEVMSAEYQVFHKFINWEKYNALACGAVPHITMSDVSDKWKTIYGQAFSKQSEKLEIPVIVDHVAYQKRVNEVTRRLLT